MPKARCNLIWIPALSLSLSQCMAPGSSSVRKVVTGQISTSNAANGNNGIGNNGVGNSGIGNNGIGNDGIGNNGIGNVGTVTNPQVGGTSSAKSFLTPNDFKPSQQMAIAAKAALASLINSEVKFYNNDGNDNLGCMGEVSVKAQATQELLILAGEYDLSQCFEQLAGSGQNLTISNAKFNLKLYFEVHCTGDDLSIYDGKTFAEIQGMLKAKNASELCALGSSSQNLSNMQSDVDYMLVAASNPQTTHHIAYTEKSAQMNGQGGPCVKTQVNSLWQSGTDCQNLMIQIPTSSVNPNAAAFAYESLQMNSLTWSEDAKFYSSGTKSFTLAGWNGVMTYAGANNAPTWTATASGQTALGIFTGPSLHLTAAARSDNELSPQNLPKLILPLAL